MAEKKQSAADKKAAGDKKSALETALAQIEKQFGKGAVMKLGQNVTMQVDAISTGSISLDMALGIGGLPRGRIVEIYGPEASGKTTLALHCIAEAQKGGGEVAFIDVEHALDPVYAKALGVDIDSLLVSQPDTGEQALEICEALVRSGAIDCVVVDSVAAMVPRAEIEGEMGDAHVGLQARLMSQAMRKLTGIIGKTGTVVIFINQLRLKVGIVYGNPEVTAGGNALKYYSSVRIDVRRTEQLKDSSGAVIGSRTRAKVVKNKVAPPFREAYFDIMFGEGISKSGELLDLAVQLGIVQKSGAWFGYGETRLGQGRDNTKIYLEEHPELFAEIEKQVRENADKLNAGKKQGRFSLFDENGDFLFSIDGETMVKNHVREGAALDAASLEALKEQSDTRKAKDKALGYLSLRDHASGELYDKLCRKFDARSAAAAVAEMQRLGLINDENFARHRAKYLADQNRSPREIRRRLAEKGIDRDAVDTALAELAPDETQACRALIEKNYGRRLREGGRDKVIAALARRGFSYGAIRAALEQCGETADEDGSWE